MFNIAQIIDKISPKPPLVILIRHAEKLPETIRSKGFFCNGITNNGILKTEKLAKILQIYNLEEIKTSPVKRCVETSQSFANVLNKNIYIKKTNILGDPGVFIEESDIAKNIFLDNKDIYSIIRSYREKKCLPGFVHIDFGTRVLLNFIYNDLKNKKSVLYISHDFIIGSFLSNLISENLFINNKLNFLDGVCFTLNNKNLILNSQNKPLKIEQFSIP